MELNVVELGTATTSVLVMPLDETTYVTVRSCFGITERAYLKTNDRGFEI